MIGRKTFSIEVTSDELEEIIAGLSTLATDDAVARFQNLIAELKNLRGTDK